MGEAALGVAKRTCPGPQACRSPGLQAPSRQVPRNGSRATEVPLAPFAAFRMSTPGDASGWADGMAGYLARGEPSGPSQTAATGIQRKCAACQLEETVQRQAPSGAPERAGALTIGPPDDRFEQEADRMADAVMRAAPVSVSPSSAAGNAQLQRTPLAPEDLTDSMPPRPEDARLGPDQPDRAPEEPAVQRSSAEGAGASDLAVSPAYGRSLQGAIAGGGQVLPPETRAFMESRFRHDFSNVRIHSDGRAATLARQIDARAFTIGPDIFFGSAEYAPASNAGRRLLAHELTHVVQQSDRRVSRQLRRTPCSSYPGYDASIDRHTYNCAGLALRTYRFTAPASSAYTEMNQEFSDLTCPAGNCAPGRVRFWMWQYDLAAEDDLGNVLSPPSPDFHIVGGRSDAAGNDPTNVYSKNGQRPIHGPGTGPSFRPATRERALNNDDQPVTLNGRPVYKVRTNMSEVISCGRCS